MSERLWFISQELQAIYLFSQNPRLALEATQFPIQLVTTDILLGDNAAEA
jgi:hypothetical protein